MRKIGTTLSKNYITSSLIGRTGNIMFQIAHGVAKSLEYNRQFVAPSHETSTRHLEKSLFRKIDFSIGRTEIVGAHYVRGDFTYNENLPPVTNQPTVYSGFYQSEKYFGRYSEVIRDLFSPSIEFMEKVVTDFPFFNNKTVASINVRRGDYLNFPTRHPVITLEYINEAYTRLPHHDILLIVSDDITWCKENINLPNIVFNETYVDCDALWLLSLCDHFIISNSTFSWWGAWLSRSDDKVVISPDTWFGPDLVEDPKDIWCDEWIKVPTIIKDGFLHLKN